MCVMGIKYGGALYKCLVNHTSDEEGPPYEEPDTNIIDWEVTLLNPEDYPSVNIIGNNYYWTEDIGVDYWGLKRTNSKGELCIGLIYFEDNLFPAVEDEDYDTSEKLVIPTYAEVTKYDVNTLGDTVVPYVGTHYPTIGEEALLDEISLALGGELKNLSTNSSIVSSIWNWFKGFLTGNTIKEICYLEFLNNIF